MSDIFVGEDKPEGIRQQDSQLRYTMIHGRKEETHWLEIQNMYYVYVGVKMPFIKYTVVPLLHIWETTVQWNCLERPLPWETTCFGGPHTPGRRSHNSMQLNLSPKTTCLERPYFYGAVFQDTSFGPKCNFVSYWTFILRPPVVLDHISWSHGWS